MPEKTKESKITVVVVNWFSYDLLSRLLDNLTAKAASAERIKYFIVDNTNGADRELNQLKNRHDRVRIDSIDSRNLKGSWAHALGLNYATTRVGTLHTLVVDPDIHIFKNNWDDFLVSELKKKQAVAIGAPYPSWKLGKYHDFPSPPFFFYETLAFKDPKMDWTPFPTNPFYRIYNLLARQIVRMGLFCTRQRLAAQPNLRKTATRLEQMFGVCGPDTGWLIAAESKKRGLRVILFDDLLERMQPGTGPLFSSFAMETLANEFELFYYNNEPIVTHKYSTSGFLWKTARGRDTQFWLDAIKEIEDSVATKLTHSDLGKTAMRDALRKTR